MLTNRPDDDYEECIRKIKDYDRLLRENEAIKKECRDARELNSLFNRRDGRENTMRRARMAAKLLEANTENT